MFFAGERVVGAGDCIVGFGVGCRSEAAEGGSHIPQRRVQPESQCLQHPPGAGSAGPQRGGVAAGVGAVPFST